MPLEDGSNAIQTHLDYLKEQMIWNLCYLCYLKSFGKESNKVIIFGDDSKIFR